MSNRVFKEKVFKLILLCQNIFIDMIFCLCIYIIIAYYVNDKIINIVSHKNDRNDEIQDNTIFYPYPK